MNRKERLTKGQNFRRHFIPIAAGLVAAGALSYEGTRGDSQPPARASVVLGRLVLNAGVNLHSSPDLDETADLGVTPVSDNIVETIQPNKSIVATDPTVIETQDEAGNISVFYGFHNVSNGMDEYVDATALSNQSINSDTTYMAFVPSVAEAEDFSITSPDPSYEATADYNSKTGQYELNGKPVAIGIETPSTDIEVAFKK